MILAFWRRCLIILGQTPWSSLRVGGWQGVLSRRFGWLRIFTLTPAPGLHALPFEACIGLGEATNPSVAFSFDRIAALILPLTSARLSSIIVIVDVGNGRRHQPSFHRAPWDAPRSADHFLGRQTKFGRAENVEVQGGVG